VRIRILKSMAGVLDRVSLGHLVPGLTYDVEESLGAYLVSTHCAEELPFGEALNGEGKDETLAEHVTRGVTITNRSQYSERTVGHDRSSRTRRRKRHG